MKPPYMLDLAACFLLPYSVEYDRKVITIIEQRTAKLLGEIKEGEVTRENHKGKLVSVEGPTSNVKTEDSIR